MLVTATQKTTRQTSRKLSLVANVVRGESLTDAIKQLGVLERRSAQVILKVMRQAVANAMHNHGAKFEDLKLKDIVINEGPRYRRFQAVSRGRAHSIIKRTSHVRVVLEIVEVDKKPVEAKSSPTPVKTEKAKPKVKPKTNPKPKATKVKKVSSSKTKKVK